MKKWHIFLLSTTWPMICEMVSLAVVYLFGLKIDFSSTLGKITAAIISTLIVSILILIFPRIIKLIKLIKWKAKIGLNKFMSKYFLYAILIALLFLILEYVWAFMASYFGLSWTDSGNSLGLVYDISVAGLCAPIVEELMFRGFMYNGLRQKFSIPVSAIVTSVIFAAIHFGSIFALLFFAFSLVFCWLREKSGSIFPGMIAHVLFNLAVVILNYSIFK